MKKQNLLILGATGGVATSFLHYFVHHRDIVGNLILLARTNKLLSNPYLEHKNLKYKLIEKEIDPDNLEEYIEILKRYKIDIVLDLTDSTSIPLLEATNNEGISYMNTSLNDDSRPVSEIVFELYSRKNEFNKAPHIVCAGMNPGIVNMWVRYGIEKFGIPKEIIHFEYDTSNAPIRLKKALITWSPHEFLVEGVRDPSGVVEGKNKIKKLLPNALKNREDMRLLMEPIVKLSKYPKGLLVLHEENITIAQKYNVPSRFIYAINSDALEKITKLYKKKKNIDEKDILLMTNRNVPLDGSDNIGVILEYPNKRVYYFNSISNSSVIGTNATYFQVVIGVFAALLALIFDKLENKLYFTEDLFKSIYKNYVFDNMRVQEFIFNKNGGKLSLSNYNPIIRMSRNNFNHLYI